MADRRAAARRLMATALPPPGEKVIARRTNSAFIGTDLEQRLRTGGHTALVVAGVITNNPVEATVRMAGNLGFATWLVADACFTFARRDWNGAMRSAEEVHAMSLVNLAGLPGDAGQARSGRPPGWRARQA